MLRHTCRAGGLETTELSQSLRAALSSSSESLVANHWSPCQGSALADGVSVLHGLRLQAPLPVQAAPFLGATLCSGHAALLCGAIPAVSVTISDELRRQPSSLIPPRPRALQGSAESARVYSGSHRCKHGRLGRKFNVVAGFSEWQYLSACRTPMPSKARASRLGRPGRSRTRTHLSATPALADPQTDMHLDMHTCDSSGVRGRTMRARAHSAA